MDIFRIKKDIPFMRYARLTVFVSGAAFAAAVALLIGKGLNLGVDFTGGTVMEVSYARPADIQSIRQTLSRLGLANASVQSFGTAQDVMIRLPLEAGVSSAQLSETVLAALHEASRDVKLRRVEFVGPQIGEELVNDGALALILVAAGIMIYLAFRFEWRFAVGAMVATAHDIVILLGLFALFQWEFSLAVLAAVLAILGYSVNDTVVVFDRIRENLRKMRKGTIPEVIDNAITRTMSRTIMTAVTTQLMVLAMLFLGGDMLFNFALALTIGIIVGAYSSVLVASPIVLWLGVSRQDLLPGAREARTEERP